MRLVDADRLKAVLEKNFGHTGGAATMLQLIDIQPTIDTEPKKGEWIEKTNIKSFRKTNVPVYECSNCNGIFCDIVTNRDFYNYCPFCGAEMRGEEDAK